MNDEALDVMIVEIMDERSNSRPRGFELDDLRMLINNRVGAMETPKAARLYERLEALEGAGKVTRFGRAAWRPISAGGRRV